MCFIEGDKHKLFMDIQHGNIIQERLSMDIHKVSNVIPVVWTPSETNWNSLFVDICLHYS